MIISRDIECAVIELLVSIAMVGNLFVDYLGVMDLTSKGKFIKKIPTRGVKARLSPINMKHDSRPQSLHLMTKGISISVMMNSINVHIIRCSFD